jgi:hypothetical protein
LFLNLRTPKKEKQIKKREKQHDIVPPKAREQDNLCDNIYDCYNCLLKKTKTFQQLRLIKVLSVDLWGCRILGSLIGYSKMVQLTRLGLIMYAACIHVNFTVHYILHRYHIIVIIIHCIASTICG